MSNIISYDDFVGARSLSDSRIIAKGCVMLELELKHRMDLEEAFDPNDLCGPKFEPESHITILFGVKDIYSLPDMTMRLAQLRSNFYHGQQVSLDSVSFFKADDHDIVKYSAESNDFIYEMNKELAESTECEDFQFKHEFKPHCTIAYVKPGLGDKYASKIKSIGLGSAKVRPTFLIYSKPSRQKTHLFLNP